MRKIETEKIKDLMVFRLQESAQAVQEHESIQDCPACAGEGLVGETVKTFTVCTACNGQKLVLK